MQQKTLFGGSVDLEERERPETMVWCKTCQDHILRTSDHDQTHTIVELDEHEPDEEDDEARKVGGRYSVEIEKSVSWKFSEYAATEAQALEKAQDRVTYGNAVDAIDVHENVREVGEVYEDDPVAEEYNLIP